MDDATAQTPDQTLPELVRFVLEHLRNLRLKGPSTLQHEHYAKVWQSLSTAGNKLIERIEDLRFHGYEQWETGDEASVQLFGRLGVPKCKKVLQNVMREFASLGTKWHVSSTLASIDTQPFNPDQVPRLVELEAVIEDVKMEDVEAEVVKKEDATKDAVTNEAVKMEAIKNEIIEPSPPGPGFLSIEGKYNSFTSWELSPALTQQKATSSFKTPTEPRPAGYRTPPRGPSFSPITPPQGVTESNSNTNDSNNPNTAPPNQPLQPHSPQRFQAYLSSINFDDDYHGQHAMFDFPTPTDVQKEISPPPPPSQLPAQSGPGTEAEKARVAEQEYMDSVKIVVAHVKGLLVLMRPFRGVEAGSAGEG